MRLCGLCSGEVSIAAINRRLAIESAAAAAEGSGFDVARGSRLDTILPLVRRALQATIVVVAAL